MLLSARRGEGLTDEVPNAVGRLRRDFDGITLARDRLCVVNAPEKKKKDLQEISGVSNTAASMKRRRPPPPPDPERVIPARTCRKAEDSETHR